MPSQLPQIKKKRGQIKRTNLRAEGTTTRVPLLPIMEVSAVNLHGGQVATDGRPSALPPSAIPPFPPKLTVQYVLVGAVIGL